MVDLQPVHQPLLLGVGYVPEPGDVRFTLVADGHVGENHLEARGVGEVDLHHGALLGLAVDGVLEDDRVGRAVLGLPGAGGPQRDPVVFGTVVHVHGQAVDGRLVDVEALERLGLGVHVHEELGLSLLVLLEAIQGEGAARALELYDLGAHLMVETVVNVEEANGRRLEHNRVVGVIEEAARELDEALRAQVELHEVRGDQAARLSAVVQEAFLCELPAVVLIDARGGLAQPRPRRGILAHVLEEHVERRGVCGRLDSRDPHVRRVAILVGLDVRLAQVV